eukprot:7217604-Pyramimonas_sp.AAC.1
MQEWEEGRAGGRGGGSHTHTDTDTDTDTHTHTLSWPCSSRKSAHLSPLGGYTLRSRQEDALLLD